MKTALIVEDVPKTGEWIAAAVCAAFPDCAIRAAATVAQGIDLVHAERFDLAIIDIRMPDGSGLDVLRATRAAQPDLVAVIITTIGDDAFVVEALAAGAQGYLLKHEIETTAARHLLRLADGLPVLSPTIARRIMEHFRLTGPADAPEQELTAREAEVLRLIGAGARNAEVARALGIGESTVASHIKAIYRKLGISSRAEAAWCASRMGLSRRGAD